MAERRMFAKAVVESDAFLDMPASAQALYFHLGMNADDDGFLNAPKRIRREVGAAEDDMKLLIAKGFVIPFDSGVVVLRHWKVNNYIQKDRYHTTSCQNEFKALQTLSTREYELPMYTECIQNVYSDKIRLDKTSQDKICLEKSNTSKQKRFKKPTVQEVQAYISEKEYSVNAQKFWDYYESKGWKVGKSSMKDWKAAVRTWQQNNKQWSNQQTYQTETRGVIDDGYSDLLSAM